MRRLITSFLVSIFLCPFLLRSQSHFSSEKLVNTNCAGHRKTSPADLDGDGEIDLVVSGKYSSQICFYLNDGNETFLDASSVVDASGFTDHFLADIDNDGDTDIVYAHYYDSDSHLGVFRNDGDASFSQDTILNVPAEKYKFLYLSDLNLDGSMDLLASIKISGEYEFKIAYYLNDGSGNFGVENYLSENALWSVIDAAVVSPMKMVTADLDNDGDIDIISYKINDGELFYHRNNGNGDFTEEVFITDQLENDLNTIATEDYDSDGDLDILIALSSYYIEPVLFFRNDGLGNFEERPLSEETTFLGSTFARFDIDGDSKKDLVTFGRYESPRLKYFLNQDQGIFQDGIPILASSFQSDAEFSPVDLDGDGDLDLLVSNSNFGDIRWYENELGFPIAAVDFMDCHKSMLNTSFSYLASTSFHWDFGNGLESEEVHPPFPYDEFGTYLLTLEVCNDLGCDTFSESVEVSHALDFEFPTNGQVSEELSFVDNSIGYTNWTWLFGDGDTSVEQNTTHAYSEPGTYLAEFLITDSLLVGCTRIFTQEIVIEESTGLELGNQSEIKLSPNPTSDFCLIEMPNTDNWKYQLYDVSGKLLLEGSFADKTFQLDTSRFKSGVYFLHLVGEAGSHSRETLKILRD